MKAKRDKWTSNLGFVIATAGSAVGLGNLWKFPYMAGNNGGGIFVIVYLVLVLIIGFTVMLAEMALGRNSGLNAIDSYAAIGKRWVIGGYISLACAIILLSYYGVLGGWVLGYIGEYIVGGGFDGATVAQTRVFYENFISSPLMPVIYQILFMAVTVAIVARGISGGIEKASSFMMPALFILFIIIMIRCLTLPNAYEGVKFFLKPDLSRLTPGVILSAMGQVFFSLSLAMGITITYGSYLDKSSNLELNSIYIPAIDTVVALMAGLTILPAIFAFGEEPSQGPGLLFVTLPSVFESLPLGRLFGAAFFVLVLFAAITSSVSIFEVPVSLVIDKTGMKRKNACILCGIIITAVGIPSCLGNSIWSDIKIFGMSIFDSYDILVTNILLPLSGLILTLTVGWGWGTKNAAAEVSNNGKIKFFFESPWRFSIKYIAPLIMSLILINSVISLF